MTQETASQQTQPRIPVGTLVRFDFTLYVEGNPKPIETSIEQVAKDHGIWAEGRGYKPLTTVLGSGNIISGLDEHISNLGVLGQPMTVILPPEKAYGPKAPLQTVPMKKFGKQSTELKVGMEVTNEQQMKGIVTRIGGGRVTIDYNHPLAGKSLRYDYRIVDVFDTDEAFLSTIIEMAFKTTTYELLENRILIPVPDHYKMQRDLTQRKFSLAYQIQRRIKKDVIFMERFEYVKPAPDPSPGVDEPASSPAGNESAPKEVTA